MGSYEPAPRLDDDRLEELVHWTGGSGMPDTHALLKELQRHRAAVAANQERVREVVRAAVVAECWPNDDDGSRARVSDAIATRVSEQLAGAAVQLSDEDVTLVRRVRERLAEIPFDGYGWHVDEAKRTRDTEVAALDRLLATRGAKP
jgi:hypothetical protein